VPSTAERACCGPGLAVTGEDAFAVAADAHGPEARAHRIVAGGRPTAEDPTDRPWGLRDFCVLDPSGYYLRLTSQE
jgi:hypothetical protein